MVGGKSHQRSVVAANLARWAAQPPHDLNRRAIFWTIMPMLLALIASRRDPAQAVFVRQVALILIGFHGVLHVSLLMLLKAWRDRGMAEAGAALAAYLAPRRVSHLDLAMTWLFFTTAVSVYRSFFPLLPSAAG